MLKQLKALLVRVEGGMSLGLRVNLSFKEETSSDAAEGSIQASFKKRKYITGGVLYPSCWVISLEIFLHGNAGTMQV